MQQLGRRGRRSEGFGAGPYELSADAWSEAVRGWWGPLRSVGVGSVSVWKQSGLQGHAEFESVDLSQRTRLRVDAAPRGVRRPTTACEPLRE